MKGYIKPQLRHPCGCGMFEIATEENDEFREKGGSCYLEVEVTVKSGLPHRIYLVEKSA